MLLHFQGSQAENIGNQNKEQPFQECNSDLLTTKYHFTFGWYVWRWLLRQFRWYHGYSSFRFLWCVFPVGFRGGTGGAAGAGNSLP